LVNNSKREAKDRRFSREPKKLESGLAREDNASAADELLGEYHNN